MDKNDPFGLLSCDDRFLPPEETSPEKEKFLDCRIGQMFIKPYRAIDRGAESKEIDDYIREQMFCIPAGRGVQNSDKS